MCTRSVRRFVLLAAAGAVAATLAVTIGPGAAQHQHGGPSQDAAEPAKPVAPTPATGARLPRRVTMEELHRGGGVPRGWKFTVPGGDRARGRQLFADLECHKCHTIKGEGFPAAGEEPKQAGPELTGMGAEHPAEYIAESILAPNHVIVDGPGFIGPDGLSTMPSFADSLSLAQWLDLVAYLQSLTTGVGDAPHTDHGIERERVMGDYRIRLVYAGRRLSVFVTDREFDEPVPYLPVTAVIQAARRPTERLRLEPRMDDHGFSYGLDLTLPPRIAKITLSIGPTTMDLAGSARKKFTQPVTVPFDWEPGHR